MEFETTIFSQRHNMKLIFFHKIIFRQNKYSLILIIKHLGKFEFIVVKKVKKMLRDVLVIET